MKMRKLDRGLLIHLLYMYVNKNIPSFSNFSMFLLRDKVHVSDLRV
ncbi:hypothetical protein MtrunA17_Chr8g0353291 [Medicago truncatula]|uniref:Uncharacterized protein n=1 Tax=Medicago truncatula TaxID=3880 RepID=A0A396GH12_MEDTR|nr:hypothetical protein MtrunA17_Chr8g0353291 [Medicago truncatula]